MPPGKPRNPFSVQFHGPGTIPYLFPESDSSEWSNLLALLDRNRWRLEISGPHGIGKSTLLHSLLEELQGRGTRCHLLKLDPRHPHLGLRIWTHLARADVLFVDSAELLPRWERRLLRAVASALGRGLVVTTHSPGMLPTVLRPTVSGERFEVLLRRLLGDDVDRLCKPPGAWLDAANGSVRQALFDLYDAYERDTVFSTAPVPFPSPLTAPNPSGIHCALAACTSP
jgi:hypothetical protein